ncbi:hypothetical protein [Halanaerobacter jeridensis]|uniref:Uncharacterized protein n=1 Tax=Halanaerobacter jeridensis TaxID=706427 RepID=A0A939BS19_9FIRM|nr:hypothetical protein [Halanaerobacter jeridensis]MBM7556641.1 hypothetical protein [Halanaerobacter jeridensis]
MKKASRNHLQVFEKIYSSEIIREKTEDQISWESEYLRSLRDVVSNESSSSQNCLRRFNDFDLSSLNWRKLSFISYLLSLLQKESK